MIFGYEGLAQAIGGTLSAAALRTRASRGKLPLHAVWCQGSLAFSPTEVQKWAESGFAYKKGDQNANRFFTQQTDAP